MTKLRNIKVKKGTVIAYFKGISMEETFSSFPKWFKVKRRAQFSLPRGHLLALRKYLNESKVFEYINITGKNEGEIKIRPRVLFTYNDLKAIRIIQAGLCCYQPVLKDKTIESNIKENGVFLTHSLRAYAGFFISKEQFIAYLKLNNISLEHFDFKSSEGNNSKSKDASMFMAMKGFKDFQAQTAVAELIDINDKFSMYSHKINNILSKKEYELLNKRLWNVSRVYKKRISWLLSLVGKELDEQAYDNRDNFVFYFNGLISGITHLRTIDYYMEMDISDADVEKLTK